jgi:ketosteroid isomerase-like protein
MSEENVEIVRVIHEGWAAGNFAVGAELFSPEFTWEQHRAAAEPGSRAGDEVGRSLRNIFDVYAEYRIDAEEFIDAGDKVVVMARNSGVAKASGMRVGQFFAFLWTVRDGSVERLRVFTTRDEALEAAGLSE